MRTSTNISLGLLASMALLMVEQAMDSLRNPPSSN